MLRSELKLELDGALAKQAQEYDTALDKQEQATKALREELSQALDYSAQLRAAKKQLEEDVAAATAREAEASQREAALQEQLQSTREAFSRKESRVKELIKEHAKARHDATEARKEVSSLQGARRRDAAVLRRVVDMTAAAMETIGLDPEERNPHPDDDTLGDHAEFFSNLSG